MFCCSVFFKKLTIKLSIPEPSISGISWHFSGDHCPLRLVLTLFSLGSCAKQLFLRVLVFCQCMMVPRSLHKYLTSVFFMKGHDGPCCPVGGARDCSSTWKGSLFALDVYHLSTGHSLLGTPGSDYLVLTAWPKVPRVGGGSGVRCWWATHWAIPFYPQTPMTLDVHTSGLPLLHITALPCFEMKLAYPKWTHLLLFHFSGIQHNSCQKGHHFCFAFQTIRKWASFCYNV